MSACVEWTGKVDRMGYGKRQFRRKSWLAHRVAWVEARGEIPDGMCVCHTCDNPTCINPEHLWLGTRTDNNADKIAKGRQYVNMPKEVKGARISAAKRGKPGWAHTPESKAKISAANKGKVRSPAHVAAMRARPGKSHSPEARAKMSIARRGRVHSPETRLKISTALRAWRLAKRAAERAQS